MVGADDLAMTGRVSKTIAAFSKQVNWLEYNSGYFYDFAKQTFTIMNADAGECKTGCQMAFRKDALLVNRELTWPAKGCDNWTMSAVKGERVRLYDANDSLHTDGWNTITTHRTTLYGTSDRFKIISQVEAEKVFGKQLTSKLLKCICKSKCICANTLFEHFVLIFGGGAELGVDRSG